MIPIVEIFGPTIQGEGVFSGKPVVFVRVGGCDYRCTFCDTWYAVDPKYKGTWTKMSPGEIEAAVYKQSPTPITVVFSGGNPALYKELGIVIRNLAANNYPSTCETQGSIPQEWFADLALLTISPKAPSMSNDFNWDRFLLCLQDAKNTPVEIKIPVFSDVDIDFVQQFEPVLANVEQITISVGNLFVTDRPQGKEGSPPADELLESYRSIVGKVLARRMHWVHILPQMHVLLWGNKKGV